MTVRRVLTAAAMAVLAAVGLTACQTHVGLAASVNGTRLTDTELSRYVQPGSAPYVDQNSGTTVVPKLFALEAWLRVQIIDATIAHLGEERSDAETRAARAELLGNITLQQVEQQYVKQGYTVRTGDLIVDESATLVVLVQRLEPGTPAKQALQDLQNTATQQRATAAISQARPKVVVSSRYGTWNARTLSLATGAGAGLPPFVKYGSTTAPTG